MLFRSVVLHGERKKDFSVKGKQLTPLGVGIRTEGSVVKYELKALAEDFVSTTDPSAFL